VIDGSRDADGETLDAAREAIPIVCFDDEMDVVGLHRVVQETERAPRGARQGRSNGREQDLLAQ